MIEVALQPREADHPAVGHLNWWGRHGRFWDFDRGFIEFDSRGNKERLDTLHSALDESVDTLCTQYRIDLKRYIKDYEICGSHAFANQRPWSDFDIQLTTEDEDTQERLRRIMVADKYLSVHESWALGLRLKIRVEIRYGEYNNKAYAECYSLRDRKLYNRTPMVAMPDTFKRRWNRETKNYDGVTRNPPAMHSIYWTPEGDEASIGTTNED